MRKRKTNMMIKTNKMKKEREAMLKKLLAEKTQLKQKTEQLAQDKTGYRPGSTKRSPKDGRQHWPRRSNKNLSWSKTNFILS